MAAYDYGRAKATADRMIARFGQAGVLKTFAAGGTSYNPTLTPTDHDVTVVVQDYMGREVDGTRVLATDKKVMMAKGDLTVEPTPAGKMVIGGVPHSIIAVDTLAPGGVTVMWTLQCRK